MTAVDRFYSNYSSPATLLVLIPRGSKCLSWTEIMYLDSVATYKFGYYTENDMSNFNKVAMLVLVVAI